MFGGKLSSRQFGVLMNLQQNDHTREQEYIDLQKAQELKNITKSKTTIKNTEELLESYRRKKVLTGQWEESQSRDLLQKELFQFQKDFPTQSSLEKFKASLKEDQRNKIQLERHSNHREEREYYFDEGLGQSLDEHIKELKQRFPKDMRIQTRRDRDGIPIVKLTYQKEFKYKLDEIEQLDAKEMRELELETKEAILREFAPEDPKEFLRAVTGQGEQFNIEIKALQALFNQRMFGKYKDDVDGFINELKVLKDQGKDLPPQQFTFSDTNVFTTRGKNLNEEQTYRNLIEDKELFDSEIQMQLLQRINDRMNSKLQKSDLVKPSRSENILYREQVESLDDTIKILERDNHYLAGQKYQDDDSATFDRERFLYLKQEIARKKEAKERILKQGLPEFKSYLRL